MKAIYWPAGGKLLARISLGGDFLCVFKRAPTDEQGHIMAAALEGTELSALREELDNEKARIPQYIAERAQTEQHLTAAEQRNARYESLLRQIIPCLAMSTNTMAPTYIRQITEALPQPTESGASE